MNTEAIKRFFLKSRAPAALVAGLALLLLLRSSGRVIHLEWMAILLWLVPPAFLVWISRSHWNRGLPPESGNLAPLVTAFVFLTLYLFSSAVFSRWFYFPNWLPSRPEYLRSGMEQVVLLTGLLMPALLLARNRHRVFLYFVFAAGVALCAHALYSATDGGKALWRDDHPSFLFRLWIFGKTFPHFLSYNPYWNAGATDFVCTTTGANAFGLLFWPLWKYLPPHVFYTAAVAAVFMLFMPLITGVAVRLSGGDRTAAIVAAIMALGVSQHFFLWMLHFGTIGAALASSFVLPVSAALYRVFWMDRREIRTGLFLILSVFFLILWPAGAIMLAPIVLGALVNFRRWNRKNILFLALCALVVLALYFRPLTLILFHKTSPLSFVMNDKDGAAPSLFTLEVLKRGWDHFIAHLVEGHPIILFLGIVGLFALPLKSIRWWYGPIFIGFALLTGWGREWKPDMQLTRMGIPMLFVAVPPAAIACSRLLRSRDVRLLPVRAALIALLFFGAYGVSKVYRNQGLSRFTFLSADVERMADWIKTNTPPDGRVLFSGRMVHAINGGHVAYLPVLTGREMMACDYYHFPPKTVEYEYPPRPFNMNPGGIHGFMDLYNVSCVVTYHDRWKQFYRHFPDRYEEAQTIGDFTFFKVNRAMNLFLQNSGSVTADFSRIDVQLDDPTNDAVIKYNWVDGLKVGPPAEIYSFDAGSKVNLIGIHPHGAGQIRITF